MKEMKRAILVLGATAIALLMTSNSGFATATQADESQKLLSNVTSTTNVAPGIYLSGQEYRKNLFDSLNYISDPDVYQLVQAIVAEMDSNGFVTSYEIEQIINTKQLGVKIVTFGLLLANNDGSKCPGCAWSPRHPLGICDIWLTLSTLYWDACLASGKDDQYISMVVGSELVDNDNRGWAFLFTGFYESSFNFDGNYWYDFEIAGFSPLIIYSYTDSQLNGQNQQYSSILSNQQSSNSQQSATNTPSAPSNIAISTVPSVKNNNLQTSR